MRLPYLIRAALSFPLLGRRLLSTTNFGLVTTTKVVVGTGHADRTTVIETNSAKNN